MFDSIVQGTKYISGNLSPADLTIIAGLLATALQYFLNRYKDFAKIVNFLLATVFPFVSVAALALLSSTELVKAYPWVFVVSQVAYQSVEWLKRNAVKKATAPVENF